MSSLFFQGVVVGVIGFAERLSYLRWLRDRGRVDGATDREVADWLGVGYKWFQKWKKSRRAPEGRTEATAIERAVTPLGASLHWLYDGIGDAPEPTLWYAWQAGGANQARAADETIVVDGITYRDVTEDVDGRDAKIVEGARLAREAAKRAAAKKSGGRKR